MSSVDRGARWPAMAHPARAVPARLTRRSGTAAPSPRVQPHARAHRLRDHHHHQRHGRRRSCPRPVHGPLAAVRSLPAVTQGRPCCRMSSDDLASCDGSSIHLAVPTSDARRGQRCPAPGRTGQLLLTSLTPSVRRSALWAEGPRPYDVPFRLHDSSPHFVPGSPRGATAHSPTNSSSSQLRV